MRKYYVYIATNQHKTVLYTGITAALERRLGEHWNDALYTGKHFTGKYQSFYLLYFEEYEDVRKAIEREKQIKGWRRDKKIALIKTMNPNMRLLNQE